MALHAAKRDSLPRLPDRTHSIQDRVDTKFFVISTALFIGLRQAMHGGCQPVFYVARGKQIPGDLFDREFIERHVAVDGIDDPVPILPDFATTICPQTSGIGVTDMVEPYGRPAYTVSRRFQQFVRFSGVSFIPVLCYRLLKSLDRFGCRRQTCDVQRCSPQPL